MNEAVTNVIVNRINDSNSEFGVITECIKEFKRIAAQKGIMNEKIKE